MSGRTIISIVCAGDRIPFDGKVVDGFAIVDESAETGFSSPVMREAVSGRDEVMAGSLLCDGWLKIESALDARSISSSSVGQAGSRGNNGSWENSGDSTRGASNRSKNKESLRERKDSLTIILVSVILLMALVAYLGLRHSCIA